MHVIARQCAVDDGHAHFIADLLDDLGTPPLGGALRD
jgi:hypothetical protein